MEGNVPPGGEEAEVLHVTKTVRDTLDHIGRTLSGLDVYSRRTRQITMALILSLVIDIALTAVVAIVASGSASEVSAVRQVQVQACADRNQRNSNEVALWHVFVGILEEPVPGQAPQTYEQKKDEQQKVSRLFQFINETFPTTNCHSL